MGSMSALRRCRWIRRRGRCATRPSSRASPVRPQGPAARTARTNRPGRSRAVDATCPLATRAPPRRPPVVPPPGARRSPRANRPQAPEPVAEATQRHSPAGEKRCRTSPPRLEQRRVVVEQREVIQVAQVRPGTSTSATPSPPPHRRGTRPSTSPSRPPADSDSRRSTPEDSTPPSSTAPRAAAHRTPPRRRTSPLRVDRPPAPRSPARPTAPAGFSASARNAPAGYWRRYGRHRTSRRDRRRCSRAPVGVRCPAASRPGGKPREHTVGSSNRVETLKSPHCKSTFGPCLLGHHPVESNAGAAAADREVGFHRILGRRLSPTDHTRFPASARRTVRAVFQHTTLGLFSRQGMRPAARCTEPKRNRPSWSKICSAVKRRVSCPGSFGSAARHGPATRSDFGNIGGLLVVVKGAAGRRFGSFTDNSGCRLTGVL